MESQGYKHESSHIGHIAFVLFAFLAGGVIGYIAGMDWEWAKNTENSASSGSVNSTKSTTSTPTTSASATTADPTAGWKTITDTTNKFSYKYPQDWTVNSSTELTPFIAGSGVVSPDTITNYTAARAKSPNSTLSIHKTDFAVTVFATLVEYNSNTSTVGKSFLDSLTTTSRYSSYSQTTLGGQTAYNAVMVADQSTYVVLAQKGDNIYRLIFPNRRASTELSANEKLILSSFTFLN